MIFLSRVTVFLAKVTDLKTFFLSSPAPDICIRDTDIEVVCFAKSTYIKGANTEDADTKGIYAKSVCIRIIGSVST